MSKYAQMLTEIALLTQHFKVPYPNITWRREDGRPIFRDTQKNAGVKLEKSVHHGEYLDLQDISREQMGAYLCIASNKIPPSVSKRITLIVECKHNNFSLFETNKKQE